ncbi:MAG: hypothetical protein QM665_02960 [Desulfovibrio sp.]
MVQIERARGCWSFCFGIIIRIEGIVPQWMPHSGGMRADLMARAAPDATPGQSQPYAVKLGVAGELRQVVPL